MRIALVLVALMLFVASAGAGEGISASSPTTLPARDAINFRPREGCESAIKDKRSKDEDRLRAEVLACAKDDKEYKYLAEMFNQRWSPDVVKYLGQMLLEDWDKTYGVSLRRPKAETPDPLSPRAPLAESNFLSVRSAYP